MASIFYHNNVLPHYLNKYSSIEHLCLLHCPQSFGSLCPFWKSNFLHLPRILHQEKILLYAQSSKLVCGEQEEQETLAGHNYDRIGLTVQLWCYVTLEAEALSWGS